MLFSKRKELERQYYGWVEETEDKWMDGYRPKDCPLNVMSFLDGEGYLRNKPIIKKLLK